MGEPGRALAGYPGFDVPRFTVAKTLRQPRQHPLGREIEDRLEARAEDVELAFAVVVDVAGGDFLVQRQVPGRSSGLDTKPRDQVLAAHLPNEAHAQLHEREPVTLWLG